MPEASHYTYRVTWSEEDEEFVGTVAEFPSLSWLAESQTEALEGITLVVHDILDDMEKTGEEPPVPLADRTYSGKFVVRTSPRVHRALALEAQEQGVSLNMLANQKLTSPTAPTAASAPVAAHIESSEIFGQALAQCTAPAPLRGNRWYGNGNMVFKAITVDGKDVAVRLPNTAFTNMAGSSLPTSTDWMWTSLDQDVR
ncbi:putative HicB family RNase H-like nuclease [Rhodococcus opacus]|nr:putative HicB family RNase H-like nuclease [Rhodococcus opacus]